MAGVLQAHERLANPQSLPHLLAPVAGLGSRAGQQREARRVPDAPGGVRDEDGHKVKLSRYCNVTWNIVW